jgi:hypothetical protein
VLYDGSKAKFSAGSYLTMDIARHNYIKFEKLLFERKASKTKEDIIEIIELIAKSKIQHDKLIILP